jgi:hypothetical protein
MTAHEYLSLYLALEKDIERWGRVMEKLRRLNSEEYLEPALRVTASYSGMPGRSSEQDKTAAAVARKADHDSGSDLMELKKKVDEAKAKMLEIVDTIDVVPINIGRQVLGLKYLQGFSMLEIADKVNPPVSVDTVRRIINESLRWVSEIKGLPF